MNLVTKQIITLQMKISKIIKTRFQNLTVEETQKIVGDIIIAVDETLT